MNCPPALERKIHLRLDLSDHFRKAVKVVLLTCFLERFAHSELRCHSAKSEQPELVRYSLPCTQMHEDTVTKQALMNMIIIVSSLLYFVQIFYLKAGLLGQPSSVGKVDQHEGLRWWRS